MIPQLIALFAADVALFVIAFGVLQMCKPRQPAPSLVVKPTMIRIPADIAHFDRTMKGAGKRIHEAENYGYKFLSLSGNVVTYKRDEMFVPAGQW